MVKVVVAQEVGHSATLASLLDLEPDYVWHALLPAVFRLQLSGSNAELSFTIHTAMMPCGRAPCTVPARLPAPCVARDAYRQSDRQRLDVDD